MAKVITRPCHSPSRAVVPVRGRAKRRQGCMWVGLLSDEIVVIRSAETVYAVEGKTARTALVRFGEGSAASKNPSTHVRSKPGPGIPPRYRDALRRGRRSEGRSRSEDERRGGVGLGHSSDETNEQSVVCHVAELAERRAGRNGRREGKAMLRTQGREAPRWVRCWTGTERHGSSSGVPSQPERGAGCVSAHVRIWAGPVG